ncbi:hypothetical protein PR048_002051 [Dryococelus australis]|uniref:Uncharacterized protein n=1 Tax=Dryococelus australis TaxID=614101 RepID=A0ABQ9IK85_9NEOP|nr:hypothetical protein PR048_002051 [Dryococelus australis]
MNSKKVDRKKRVVLVTQEISLAKILASNERGVRERGVRKLRKWLSARSRAGFPFKEDDMMRVWKGLFYSMWMADKPLVQEQVAENVSQLVHAVDDDVKFVSLFVSCFMRTMSREWHGIDHYRLDKFSMLVRRVVRQSLVFCLRAQWASHVVQQLGDVFSSTVLCGWPARSLSMHFCELFLVELGKVGAGRLPTHTTHAFLQPFVAYLAREKDALLRSHVVEHVFHHLVRQSEFGQDYQARFDAWKSAGFPGTSWEQMELVELSGEEDEEERQDAVCDPRAGSVHVELKPLLFEPAVVADQLLQQRAATFDVHNRKTLKDLADDFTKMSKGKYPLKLTNFGKMNKYIREVRNASRCKRHTLKVTKKLLQFETRLMQQKGGVRKKSKQRKVKNGG